MAERTPGLRKLMPGTKLYRAPPEKRLQGKKRHAPTASELGDYVPVIYGPPLPSLWLALHAPFPGVMRIVLPPPQCLLAVCLPRAPLQRKIFHACVYARVKGGGAEHCTKQDEHLRRLAMSSTGSHLQHGERHGYIELEATGTAHVNSRREKSEGSSHGAQSGAASQHCYMNRFTIL